MINDCKGTAGIIGRTLYTLDGTGQDAAGLLRLKQIEISGLFSAKSYNLDSLTVGVTEDSTISRMTISLTSDDKTFEQIKKQLSRTVYPYKQDFFHVNGGVRIVHLSLDEDEKWRIHPRLLL